VRRIAELVASRLSRLLFGHPLCDIFACPLRQMKRDLFFDFIPELFRRPRGWRPQIIEQRLQTSCDHGEVSVGVELRTRLMPRTSDSQPLTSCAS
jgi:hypothetical protein